MALVTAKNKYQVVIPQAVRKQLGINRGDLLEARVERGKLTYTRKTVVDPIPSGKTAREKFFRELRETAPEWMQNLWASSKRAGLDKLTMREIDAEIAAARRERRTKRAGKNAAR